MFKWIGRVGLGIVGVLVAIPLLFNVLAALRETQTAQAAAPASGHFVETPEGRLFVEELGPSDGPAVMFIHGAGAWGGLWMETMTAFAAQGYHCIAIDLPPFGFSERPATASYGRVDQAKRIIAVLDALKVEKVILVGHSFGGGATMETALRIPDRVEAMVLADVGGLGLTQGGPPSALVTTVLGMGPVRHVLIASTLTNPLLSKSLLQALILDPADATEARVAILQRPMVIQGSTDAAGAWLNYTLNSQEVSLTSEVKNYQTLAMPVLIVWGDSDTTIPLSEGQYLQSILPNAKLEVMQGVNHIPQVEDVETFEKLSLEFLAGLGP